MKNVVVLCDGCSRADRSTYVEVKGGLTVTSQFQNEPSVVREVPIGEFCQSCFIKSIP